MAGFQHSIGESRTFNIKMKCMQHVFVCCSWMYAIGSVYRKNKHWSLGKKTKQLHIYIYITCVCVWHTYVGVCQAVEWKIIWFYLGVVSLGHEGALCLMDTWVYLILDLQYHLVLQLDPAKKKLHRASWPCKMQPFHGIKWASLILNHTHCSISKDQS